MLDKHTDLATYAAGKVFYGRPGIPAFPIRLMDVVFQICFPLWQAEQNGQSGPNGFRCTLYDPCCGTAYHLSTLAYFHWSKIDSIIASDIDETVLETACRNLSLLTIPGINKRLDEIQAMIDAYQKDSHQDALLAATFLKGQLIPFLDQHPIKTAAFAADALNPAAITSGLSGTRPNIIFADVPYGLHSQWKRDPDSADKAQPSIWQLLDNALRYSDPSTVIAIAANKDQKVFHDSFRVICHLRHGKRHIVILKRHT